MDKWSQRLAKNQTDLMPKNASCKRWDTPIYHLIPAVGPHLAKMDVLSQKCHVIPMT